MSEISMTNRKEPIINLPNRSWVKAHCYKCPYFVRMEALDQDDREAVRCVKPIDEECLAESLLVSIVLTTEAHNEVVKQMYEKKSQPVDKPVGVTTLKRCSKIHKRRR